MGNNKMLFNPVELFYIQAIFEARFSSQLIVLDKNSAVRLNKRVKKSFISRQYSDSNIVFATAKNEVTANVLLDKIGLMMPNDVNLDKFSTYIREFAPDALSMFDVDQLTRIGLRVIAVSETTSLNEAVSTFHQLTKIPKDSTEILGSLIGYGLKISVNTGSNLMVNLSINPGQEHKIQVSPEGTTDQTKYGAMIDMDFYQEGNIRGDNITNFLKNSILCLRNKVYPFLSSLE